MDITLQNLNSKQQEAVTHEQGPLLIVAGAGTGKTTVITQRIGWLVETKELQPDQILALTFTEKAAAEMEERVDRVLPYGYVDLWISTFHSFAEKILQQHALEIGLPTDFKLLNQTESWLLVKKNLDRFDLDYYRPMGNPTKFIHALLQHFSRCKDEEVYPEHYLAYAEELKLNLDAMESSQGKAKKSKAAAEDDEEVLAQETARLNEVANAYHTYQQLLLEHNALDFGDLINYTLKLFKTRPKVLQKYQQQFEYILIDEFQDTNWAQYELIKLLAAPKNNITVVGDDDQCLPGNTLVATPTGNKQIKKVVVGEQVVSAAGKGHLCHSTVTRVFANKKKVRYLTITLQNGKTLQVTDNHKMFCRIPAVGKSTYWYVYLMERKGLGWRLGVTGDLTTRLRLERTADRIIAVRGFTTEKEARYHETLWSLKYAIPTVCFKLSRGRLSMNEASLQQLYTALDVATGVEQLARDLHIDLAAHHYTLQGVVRGDKKRTRLYLTMCHWAYRSKNKKTNILDKPKISHLLQLETADQEAATALRAAGFSLTRAKKGRQGWRLRMQSQNLQQLGGHAARIQAILDCIFEVRCSLGTSNQQHLPSIVMPAKNLQLGMSVPVVTKTGVRYCPITAISEHTTTDTVYDLEVAGTHNFVANDIVVHNSIYKFRGASVSNILHFKKDYKEAQEIFLQTNYRSPQKILDLSYQFIQLNNPDRLEVKLQADGKKLSKQLEAHKKEQGIIEYAFTENLEAEVTQVVDMIIKLYESNKTVAWSDFAILLRANASAQDFIQELEQRQVPYQFLAARGLYQKPVIRDIINYLRLLDDYRESPALFRILSMPILDISQYQISNLMYWAGRKSWSVFEVLKHIHTIPKVHEETQKEITKLVGWIDKHTQAAKEQSVWQVVLVFLEDTGYIKHIESLEPHESKQTFDQLNQFAKKIKEFEKSFDENKVSDFMQEFELELESGDTGNLLWDMEEGPETVKIMTIHAAKGLEFEYVFIPNLVDKRFPTIRRGDPIALPDALVKDILPEGDSHMQEERRLLYVALTRARQGLFLSGARDYGGQRAKKPSIFLHELQLAAEEQKNKKADILTRPEKAQDTTKQQLEYKLPDKFSFTQIKAFQSCPLQYKYAHILRIPVQGKHTFSFGKSMHNTLQHFFELVRGQALNVQGDLFGGVQNDSLGEVTASLDDMLKLYEEHWIDDWYDSKEQRAEYRKKGREALKQFYEDWKQEKRVPEYLEKGFNVKIADYTLKGVIDRIDRLPNGRLEIIDYKTGKSKTEKTVDKTQLLIYQLAIKQAFQDEPEHLTFYYVEDGTQLQFLGNEKQLEKVQQEVVDTIEKIKQGNFTPTPSPQVCKFCDFNKICDFSQG